MPVYRLKLRGEDRGKIVKASSAAKARDHLVEASAMSSDDLADAMANGEKIEIAGAAPADPPAEEKAPDAPQSKEPGKEPAKD